MHAHRRLLGMMVLCVGLTLLAPSVAGAHAFLVRTVPQAGSRLAASPPVIDLQFSEAVTGPEVNVKSIGGSRLAAGLTSLLQGGQMVETILPPLGDGVYTVSWKVVADDGHVTVGEFSFAVGAHGQIPTVASPTADATARLAAIAHWFLVGGLALALGGLVSERAIWDPIGRRRHIAFPRVALGRVLRAAFAASFVQLGLLVEATGGGRITGNLVSRTFTTRAPLLAAATVLLVAYSLWLATLHRTRVLAVGPVSLALSAVALGGHAGSSDVWWAAPANAVHVVSVALWLGLLGHLVLVIWRLREPASWPVLIVGIQRYAALALVVVLVALVSGGLVALSLFTRPVELIITDYGRLLLIKASFVAIALGCAVVARSMLGSPLVSDQHTAHAHWLRWVIRPEGVLLGAATVTAVVLAQSPPPQSVDAVQELLGPPPFAGPVVYQAAIDGLLAVYVGASEGQLRVWTLTPSGDPVSGAKIALSGHAPDGAGFDVLPRRCGPGCATAAFPWHEGTTALSVAVTARNWNTGTVQFSIPWPPQPNEEDVLNRVLRTMRAQPQIRFTERVSPSAGDTRPYDVVESSVQFFSQELYGSGGASDIRSVPPRVGVHALTLFVTGSSAWYALELDAQDRLVQETVVTPGHLIERTFTYDVRTGTGGKSCRTSPSSSEHCQ